VPNSSKKRNALFAAIMVVGALFLLEAFASWALLLRMRLQKTEYFTETEPTYFSLLNIPYKAGLRFGFFDRSLEEYRVTKEPNPQFEPDPELGYTPLPGKYRIIFSRRASKNSEWKRLFVNATIKQDGTRGPASATFPAALMCIYSAGVQFMDTALMTNRRLRFYCSKQGRTCA
jgi:hypothetical protein